MVYLSCRLLWQRLWVCSIFYPYLGLLSIWTIPSYAPLVLSKKETVLPLLLLILVSIPILAMAISLAFELFLRRVVWTCLRRLLAASLLFYIEDLLALLLLWLRLALASTAPLGVPAIALELLTLVVLF